MLYRVIYVNFRTFQNHSIRNQGIVILEEERRDVRLVLGRREISRCLYLGIDGYGCVYFVMV